MSQHSSESLRSLTLKTIDNYRKAAKFATQAVRTSSSRGVTKVDKMLTKYEGKFSPAVKTALNATNESILAVTHKTDQVLEKAGRSVKSSLSTAQDAMDTVVDKTNRAVDKVLSGTSKQIAKLPPKSGKLGQLLQNETVKKVEGFGVPGAKLICRVSEKVAEGAEQLSRKVAAPTKTKTKAKAKTATRLPARKAAAKKAVKTTLRRTRAKTAEKAAAHSA